MGETFPYISFVKNGKKNQIEQGHELGVKCTHTQKKLQEENNPIN